MAEVSKQREFSDLLWQVVKNRGCDEIAIRYDCGHTLRAEVLAPSLPRTQEYGTQELERRRFTQHCIHVLTKDPSATKVQVTVPEGRCGHCHRGNRQALLCGLLQMGLTEDDGRATIARRLELPLSSHSFMAAMGQVCKFPENITPPRLQGHQGSIRLFDGPPLSKEEALTRKEIEDQLKADVMRYIYGATFLLLTTVVAGFYFFVKYLGPSEVSEGDNITLTGDDVNSTSASGADSGIANSAWAFSLTIQLFMLLGGGKDGTSFLWTVLTSPINTVALLFHYLFLRPTILLSQLPIVYPMIAAILFSLTMAALSAPHPLSLSVPSATSRKDGRPKGGIRVAPAGARNQKGDRLDRVGRADVPGGKPERLNPVQKEGKVSSGTQQSVPACFVCLDRPSRYVLEPCGHRVVCQECAVQLVDAVIRNSSASDAAGGAHCASQGGACPSCGMAIMRAMRLFS